MRSLTFRKKLVLAFLLVIVGAVGASLIVVEHEFRVEQERRLADASERIQTTCDHAREAQVSVLSRGCRIIAEQPRLRAVLLEATETGGLDTENLGYVGARVCERLGISLFSVVDRKTGHCVMRSIDAVTQAGNPAGAPEEVVAAKAFKQFDEKQTRFQRTESSDSASETEKARARAEMFALTSAHGYLIQQGVLYQVVALPVQVDEFEATSDVLAAVVVGVRMAAEDLAPVAKVIDRKAAIALVIGDEMKVEAGPSAGTGLFPSTGCAALVEELHRAGGRFEYPGPPPYLLAMTTLPGVSYADVKRPEAVILVRLSTKSEHDAFERTITAILSAAGIVVLLGALAGFLMAAGMSRPITDLVEGTKRVATGDYGVDLPVRSRDELGMLTGAFNEMARGLADRERYRAVLTKVVSKEVAHELMSQMRGRGLDFQGVSHRCTMLFSDIRGFTPLTEHMSPADIISMLNEHMTAMVRVIERHRGVVNKFVGDEIIGVFGAPVAHEDDALWAVRAGMEMVAEVRRMNAERAEKGKKEINVGVGINTGDVVCGVMGAEERAEYTVLGAPVNLTARLCSGAKPMQVLITSSTLESVKDHVDIVALGGQSYKGWSEPIPVFEVRAVRPSASPRPVGTRS